jgi:hypothetical protein
MINEQRIGKDVEGCAYGRILSQYLGNCLWLTEENHGNLMISVPTEIRKSWFNTYSLRYKIDRLKSKKSGFVPDKNTKAR